MAGSEISEEQISRLRLLVDKEKNKVVLAEADKLLVDVFCSFLTMPMGSIVRSLEIYQQNRKSQALAIGCFNNLYRSVVDMSSDNFLTKACKHMLLYPTRVKNRQFYQFNFYSETELRRYYRCPKLGYNTSCFRAYSNFCSSRCSCGALMDTEFHVSIGVEDGHDEMLVNGITSLIITDDLKLLTSMDLTLKTLRELGYTDVDELHEMLVDVSFNKVFALLEYLFSSDTPLTDVFLKELGYTDIEKLLPALELFAPFGLAISTMLASGFGGGSTILKDVILKEQKSGGIMRMFNMPNLLSVKLFIRKQEKKVLYIECGEDFVDLLFTFLAIPLKSVWELSGSNAKKGCIGNLCNSFRKVTTASTSRCMLPWYYSCQRQLLDICYEVCVTGYVFTKDSLSYVLKPRDPRCDGSAESTTHCGGFVKRGTKFIVSDDLIITPMNSFEVIRLLKKMNADLDDIEEQVINITKAEATGLLRASLLTSTALGSLLVSKKPKEENSKASMSLLGKLIFNWCNFRFL